MDTLLVTASLVEESCPFIGECPPWPGTPIFLLGFFPFEVFEALEFQVSFLLTLEASQSSNLHVYHQHNFLPMFIFSGWSSWLLVVTSVTISKVCSFQFCGVSLNICHEGWQHSNKSSALVRYWWSLSRMFYAPDIKVNSAICPFNKVRIKYALAFSGDLNLASTVANLFPQIRYLTSFIVILRHFSITLASKYSIFFIYKIVCFLYNCFLFFYLYFQSEVKFRFPCSFQQSFWRILEWSLFFFKEIISCLPTLEAKFFFQFGIFFYRRHYFIF